jgi:hypothetical protein
LRIISQFKDDEDGIFAPSPGASERLTAVGITGWFRPKFVPIVCRWRSVTKPTLALISPADVGARSRPFGAADDHHGLERPELHGNFSLTAAAAGARPLSPLENCVRKSIKLP